VASDSDAVLIARLADRQDDDLFLLAGTAEQPDIATDALLRLLDPPTAEGLEADGLLPRVNVDAAALRSRGRALVDRIVTERRAELQALVARFTPPKAAVSSSSH